MNANRAASVMETMTMLTRFDGRIPVKTTPVSTTTVPTATGINHWASRFVAFNR
jgi:hypothetical protein